MKSEIFRIILSAGLSISEKRYKKFVINNYYWLSRSFVPGVDDYIVVSKYRYQIVNGHYKCLPGCRINHKRGNLI